MKKPKRKLTAAEKAVKRQRRKETMIVFINGKQKRVKRPPTIEGLDVDEFIRRNADPIWLHQNEMWEYMTEGEFSEEPMSLCDKCPTCGGDLEEKVVEKLLRGGNHTDSVG
jgi:hypothetical protein